ncbi:DUF362 domain-containing protein [archaeon]|nr:DUF362 domain-containing protein [archaeon]
MVTFRPKEIIKLKKSCREIEGKSFKIEKPALVSEAKSVTKAVNLAKGLEGINKGDSVLIKPNINSDDKYPGTTRPAGLKELIKLLKKKGAVVTVGDMSSAFWSHTKICSEAVGIKRVCNNLDVPLRFFENSKWVKVKLPETSLKNVWLTDELCKHKHLINLAVLKTHRLADFTLSLKNLMGCLHMRTRMRMHARLLKQRIGEFNKALTPVLNIIDGTKCFIDGGPDTGELRKPGVIMASRDRVALDVACVKKLKKLGSKSLKELNPWSHPQIKHAVKHGLGVKQDKDIKLIK